ncbi:MAG: hypothetical protein ACERKN_17455 [Velocimicrobium sp.]
MVTFARAIRIDKMSSFTNDFEKLTGNKARTVSHMFANCNDYQVGQILLSVFTTFFLKLNVDFTGT